MTCSQSGRVPRFAVWIAAAIIPLIAACSSIETKPVADAPAGFKIEIVTGLRTAKTPPDPRTASLSTIETTASLRRIMVRYIKYSAAFKTDAQTLLSDSQIDALGVVLAREVPLLKENQRLRISFDDRYFGKGYLDQMDVYREGTFLVYWFNSLATNFSTPNIGGEGKYFLGVLQKAAPGQEIESTDAFAYLKDPVLNEERDAAAAFDDKKKLLDQAAKDGVVDPDEAKRIEGMIAKPAPTAYAWSVYWDKRRTIKKALDQNLMDRASYQVQLDKLNAELNK